VRATGARDASFSFDRAYTADNTLTKLVKEKKLKRTLVVGGWGSQYSVA
jgi:putative NADH-flavin reductase